MKYFVLINFVLAFFNTKSFSAGLVRVKSLDDTILVYNPAINTGNAVSITNFCVARVGLSTSYTIKFTSSNASGTIFRARNSSGNYLVYSVFYYTTTNASNTPIQMSSGSPNTNLSFFTINNCPSNSDNSSMKIVFNYNNLISAVSGVYTDVLTITISAV